MCSSDLGKRRHSMKVKICHENRGEDLINKLVDKAKEGGGTDNITATVIY